MGRKPYTGAVTQEQAERMLMLQERHGLTYPAIAQRFGVSARTVCHYITKLRKERSEHERLVRA